MKKKALILTTYALMDILLSIVSLGGGGGYTEHLVPLLLDEPPNY